MGIAWGFNTGQDQWEKFSAGRALDKHIAACLGWDNFYEDNDGDLYADTPQDRASNSGWQTIVPTWSTDLNAALTLIDNSPNFILWRGTDVWCATLNEYCTIEMPVWNTYETADTPALAVCRAWLRHSHRIVEEEA